MNRLEDKVAIITGATVGIGDATVDLFIKEGANVLMVDLSEDELRKLIEKRTKLYSKAQFKINCYKLTKGEIVKKILNIYESN